MLPEAKGDPNVGFTFIFDHTSVPALLLMLDAVILKLIKDAVVEASVAFA